jgi:hypothetical protein
MEGMFRQLGIYSSEVRYKPEDLEEIAGYRESKDGQVLEEGINKQRLFRVDGGRDLLQFTSIDADTVLHLLFDVRVSAYWRFCVGCR